MLRNKPSASFPLTSEYRGSENRSEVIINKKWMDKQRLAAMDRTFHLGVDFQPDRRLLIFQVATQS